MYLVSSRNNKLTSKFARSTRKEAHIPKEIAKIGDCSLSVLHSLQVEHYSTQQHKVEIHTSRAKKILATHSLKNARVTKFAHQQDNLFLVVIRQRLQLWNRI